MEGVRKCIEQVMQHKAGSFPAKYSFSTDFIACPQGLIYLLRHYAYFSTMNVDPDQFLVNFSAMSMDLILPHS